MGSEAGSDETNDFPVEFRGRLWARLNIESSRDEPSRRDVSPAGGGRLARLRAAAFGVRAGHDRRDLSAGSLSCALALATTSR